MLRLVLLFLWALCLGAGAQQPFGLDTTFRTVIGSERISSLLVLPDGKLIVAGWFDHPNSGIERGVGRLLADGGWDLSFDESAWGTGHIEPWQDHYYVSYTLGVRRLQLDGARDWSFDMDGADYFTAGQMGDYHLYDDGSVVITGDHLLSDTIRGFEGYHQLIWFTNEGKLDTTRIHRRCDGFVYRIFPLPDGKFLLSGNWTEYEGTPMPNSTRLIRVFADGSLDTTFQAPFDLGRPHSHYPLPDGKHLLTGIMGLTNDEDTVGLVRLLPDGALDSTFNNHLQFLRTYANDPAYTGALSVVPIGEDRFVITGAFTFIDGQARGGIAMIDTSGHLVNDHFTGTGCGIWNDGFQDQAYIWAIVPAPDGSYYIHGSYHGYDDGMVNDTAQRMVSRLYGLDVGVQEDKALTTVKVYPNPASGSFRLEGLVPGEPTEVVVYDGLGKAVRAWRLASAGAEFDVRALMPGLYTLRVAQEDKALGFIKLIIQ